MGKVLLVEDNTNAVKKIVRYIDNISADLEVHSVSEAGEALQYAKANDVSLFILDIQLEDYKGTSLAKQLRELPEYKYTPIIFETALAGEELSAYRDVKCYSFLVKPFGEEEFVTAFRDALGLSKQMSQQAKTIQIEQKQFILEYVTQDIAYIEAFGKKLVIHTSSRLSGIKEDTISGYTLSGLLALLDDPAFVQCHKSYVVNKSHIEKIDKSGRKIFLKGFTDTIPSEINIRPNYGGKHGLFNESDTVRIGRRNIGALLRSRFPSKSRNKGKRFFHFSHSSCSLCCTESGFFCRSKYDGIFPQ